MGCRIQNIFPINQNVWFSITRRGRLFYISEEIKETKDQIDRSNSNNHKYSTYKKHSGNYPDIIVCLELVFHGIHIEVLDAFIRPTDNMHITHFPVLEKVRINLSFWKKEIPFFRLCKGFPKNLSLFIGQVTHVSQ